MQLSALSTVVCELSLLLPGARITRVFESPRKDLCLILKTGRNKRTLLISPDRALPRLHLIRQKPLSLPDLHPFTQFLKSRMTGGTIRSIGLLNQDRIAEIRFGRENAEFRLLVEVLGSAANLVVTDERHIILAVYHPSPVAGKRCRPLLPGLRYELPARTFPPPDEGLLPRDEKVSGKAIETGSAERNRQIELVYSRLIDQRRIESMHSEILALTRRLHAKSERRLRALFEDQRTAQQAEDHKRAGNAILANLNALLPGMSRASLVDFDGKAVDVVLDPGISAADNAGRYFKKYKKAKAGLEIIARRLQLAEEETVFLAAIKADMERAVDESDILAVRNILIEKGYIKIPGKSRKALAVPAPYRKILHRGWEIVIGKNAAGNDLITTRLARASDLWLHAEGLPGSHVLVKNPNETEIPLDVLEKAAGFAAFYSRGKNASKVAVTYTFARFVKKPKGAKPGMVTLSERKTVMAVPAAEQGNGSSFL